jgi:hypothetical protein
MQSLVQYESNIYSAITIKNYLAMSFGAHIIGYLWDRFTFIPWYIMVSHTEKLRIAGRVKSVQDENDPTLWKSGDSKGIGFSLVFMEI